MTEDQRVQCGKVFLVGAGPGDPDLLTVKALRTIQNCDLILYDQLVSEPIQALFPRRVPAVYVGKCKERHSISQSELNGLLVKWAKQGKRIARVKGGDPFVFGRGSEEMLALREANIDVEVIPGITSASGCSTYASFPLTHRGLATGCTLVTAHSEHGDSPDWGALSKLDHTLVFYMGLTKAPAISDGLIDAGMNPDTPAAVIENGCRPDQRTVVSTLAELPQSVHRHSLQSPALIVVGSVVSLRDRLLSPEVCDTPCSVEALGQARVVSHHADSDKHLLPVELDFERIG